MCYCQKLLVLSKFKTSGWRHISSRKGPHVLWRPVNSDRTDRNFAVSGFLSSSGSCGSSRSTRANPSPLHNSCRLRRGAAAPARSRATAAARRATAGVVRKKGGAGGGTTRMGHNRSTPTSTSTSTSRNDRLWPIMNDPSATSGRQNRPRSQHPAASTRRGRATLCRLLRSGVQHPSCGGRETRGLRHPDRR